MPAESRQTSSATTFAASRDWGAVADLAATQYGVVSLRQLGALRVGASVARDWVARGLLIRLHREVFAVGHASLRQEAHFLAGVLACGDDAALSHRSAGMHLEIRRVASSFIEVTSPSGRGRTRDGLRVHTARLRPDEVIEHDGIPCTSVARTLIDLAAVLPVYAVQSAVEASERLEVFDLREVTTLLARHRGRRGVAKLRQVLGVFDAEVLRARSESEARIFHLCVDHGFPAPFVNRLVDAGPDRFEVDCHWPDVRLVVEVDSPYHDTTAARRRDAARDAALRRYGWIVIRCRWADIVTNPEPLLRTLRRYLPSASRG